MPELRWALIGLGLAFFVGLMIFEWRRKSRSASQAGLSEPAPRGDKPRRIEPGLDVPADLRAPVREARLEVPVIHPTEQLHDRPAVAPLTEPVRVAAEAAVDVPAAARRAAAPVEPEPEPQPTAVTDDEVESVGPVRELPREEPPAAVPVEGAGGAAEIRWPPQKVDRALSLRVVGRGGMPLSGRALRLALEGTGFVPGPQTIYHRVDASGGVLVSAASMVQPGTLDPAQIDSHNYRGVALFSVLPGPLPPAAMLEGLVEAARALARRLDALVQDGGGAELNAARLEALRQSLPEEQAP